MSILDTSFIGQVLTHMHSFHMNEYVLWIVSFKILQYPPVWYALRIIIIANGHALRRHHRHSIHVGNTMTMTSSEGWKVNFKDRTGGKHCVSAIIYIISYYVSMNAEVKLLHEKAALSRFEFIEKTSLSRFDAFLTYTYGSSFSTAYVRNTAVAFVPRLKQIRRKKRG